MEQRSVYKLGKANLLNPLPSPSLVACVIVSMVRWISHLPAPHLVHNWRLYFAAAQNIVYTGKNVPVGRC